MIGVGLWVIVQAVVVLFLLWLGVRLVRAVEGIERLLARAVAQYERKSP